MPRNSSGTYSLPAGNPVVSGTVIASTWANNTLSDISTALTGSLSRSGQGAMQAQLQLTDGAVGTPALSFASEVNGGLYRAGAGDFRISINANDVIKIKTGGVTFFGVSSGTLDGYSVNIDSTIPGIFFNDSDAAANTKGYYFLANAGSFQIGLYNDAFTSSAGLVFNRTAGAWTSINVGNATDNPTFTFLGSGAIAAGGAVTISTAAGQLLVLNSTATNGPFSTWLSSSTAFGDVGSQKQVFGTGNATDFGVNARGGTLALGTNNTSRLAISNAGNVTISAPSSGDTLTVVPNATAGVGISINPAAGHVAYFVNSGAIGLAMNSAGTNYGFLQNDSADKWSLATGTTLTSLGTDVLSWNKTGNVTIPAPASGVGLSVNGFANAYAQLVTGSSTASQSFGLIVRGGTNSSDTAFAVQNQTGGTNFVQVFGDGGVALGSPTGGDKGLGTLNATGLFINNVAVSSSIATGTFTGTLTGYASPPTGTVSYTVQNGLVTLYLSAQIQGTSNANTMTMTGLPAAVQPSANRAVFTTLQNNSGGLEPGAASITTSTITFSVPLGSTAYDPSGFATSNLKGLFAGWTITYPL